MKGNILGKIIYECQYFKIRVRDILAIVIILLLFICLKGCQEEKTQQEIREKKEEKIQDVCTFTNENINDLSRLLESANLCSNQWFDDLNDYISRIKEQNDLLKNEKEKDYQQVYQLQIKLYKKLKAFQDNQSHQNIDQLHEIFNQYKDHYENKCVKKKE